MDHSRLRFETVIDWIELEICTAEPTNFWTVQLAFSQGQQPSSDTQGVTAIDSGSGGAASRFRFRLQDPKSMTAVRTLLARVGQRLTLQSTPTITAIEVAFDTYQPGANLHQLATIAADRYRWSTQKPSHDWNFYRRPGEGRVYLNTTTQREAVQHFADHWQLTDAATKDEDTRLHAYVKTTDAGQALQPHQWRARFEVTLSGKDAPCITLDHLEHFDFTRLAKHFQFRKFADDNPHPAVAYARRWPHAPARQYGRRGSYRRKNKTATGWVYSGTSIFKSWTAADSKLTDEAYQQLRKLTRSWRGNRK